MKKNRKLIFYIIFGAVLFIAGCSTVMFKNWGSIRPDTYAINDFEKFQINTNLNYYISGSDVYPTSILGLNKAYTLDTDLWKKIEMTPELFSELVTNMQTRLLTCCGQKQVGFVILDDKGKKIGIWYSMLMGSVGVKMKEDNKVIIYPPKDDVYIQYEDKTIGGKSFFDF
jgi:hypothetical protein